MKKAMKKAMNRVMNRWWIHLRAVTLGLTLALGAGHVRADSPLSPQDAVGHLTLAKVFGDHMVLQQGLELPVWGSAAAGERVTVTFAGQEVSAIADPEGKWLVKLRPIKAQPNQQGAQLVVGGRDKTVTIQDVLVGEVWLGSGQSNMVWPVSQIDQIDADFPQIRLRAADGSWKAAMKASVPGFSSLMWHFGRKLHEELDVPVGLIVGAVGATSANQWVADGALLDPEVQKLVDICRRRLAEYKDYFDRVRTQTKMQSEAWDKLTIGFLNQHLPAEKMAKYATSLGLERAEHLALIQLLETVLQEKPQARDQWRVMWTDFVGRHDPGYLFLRNMVVADPSVQHPFGHLMYAEPPSERLTTGWFCLPPFTTDVSGDAGVQYKMHIQPLAPVAMRGVVWDQGESGSGIGGVDHWTIMRVLIESWRRAWAGAGGHSEFAWINMQKPSGGGCAFQYEGRSAPFEPEYPAAIPAQNTALVGEYHNRLITLPNTSVAITSDLGWGIHPQDKDHPRDRDRYGQRAARVALGFAYGRNVEYLGPVYDSHTVSGNKFVIKFKHVGQGLTARHIDEVRGFMIAGEDRKFRWAQARIAGNDTVEVWSDEVAKPASVRYAYARWHPWANLFNRDGLPMLPFRTDNWTWPNMLPEYFEQTCFGVESVLFYWVCDPENSK